MASTGHDSVNGVAAVNMAEPIAIIGVACRFSGIATSPSSLWQLLRQGKTSWSNNARNRFKLESFWHPHPQRAGSFNCRGMHLLHQDLGVFDNDFFGISGIEAKAIDPQQRLMLEVAYEAFESAGVPLSSLEGSNTGVYCAVSYFDYDGIQARDPEVSASYRFTGTGPSMMANRISYVFDMRGPSITLDTACSSTLVAIHEACKSLRLGEASQVLVGGSSLILDPDKLAAIATMQFLSPHGRCYAFDSRANGYARGEGVAAILLKPLDAAIRDGDNIRGVIRGSAVGLDGRTPGITMPSSTAQTDTILRAYKAAGLDPAETFYVEAHGTGTAAGDKCESDALANTFCAGRAPGKSLMVGSVKANLGHTECVSGLAGLIKALLVLEKGSIVPNPTFVSVNPNLGLEAAGIEVPTKVTKWPDKVAKRASINSCGYGGVNAHVVLDLGPVVKTGAPATPELPGTGPKVFVWTHQREHELGKLATVWKRFLLEHQSGDERLSLDSLAFTLGSRRSIFPYRAAVVADGVQELLDGLNRLEIGQQRAVKAAANPRLCFVFTGQGAQWARMGHELIFFYPVFAESLRKAEEDLLSFGAEWRLLGELGKAEGESRINDAELAQPCCTAIQIAFVDLLDSFGVRPERVCGHSSGEIAAAFTLGALTSSEALKVAYYRGQAVRRLKEAHPSLKGAMLAVGLSQAAAAGYIAELEPGGGVTVACINSPSSVTLSGDAAAIEQLHQTLDAAGIFNRKLAVGVAYHSHHMAVVEEFYSDAIKDIQPHECKPGIQMVSSVTGKTLQGDELGAAYWTQNLLLPVRFSDALTGVLGLSGAAGPSANSPAVLLELGPHATLRGPIQQILKEALATHSTSYHHCLSRGKDGVVTSLAMAGELFALGVPISLNRANKVTGGAPDVRVLTDLPLYNWHHEKVHWNESRRSAAHRFRKFPHHDLLGSLAPDSISAEPLWRNYLRLSDVPWLKGHSVDGSIVFSVPTYILMVMEALKQQSSLAKRGWRAKLVTFRDMSFGRPLLVPTSGFGAETFVQLRPYSPSARESSLVWQELRVFSLSVENESTEHCRGLVAVLDSKGPGGVGTTGPGSLHRMTNGEAKSSQLDGTRTRVDPAKFYTELESLGIEYSDPWRSLESIMASPWQSECQIRLPDLKAHMPSSYLQPYCIHPMALDGCFQAVFSGLKLSGRLQEAGVVSSIDCIQVSTDGNLGPGDLVAVTTRSAEHGLRQNAAEFSAAKVGAGGRGPVIRATGVKFSMFGSQRNSRGPGARLPGEPLCHRLEWRLDPFCSDADAVLKHCRKGLVGWKQERRNRCDLLCRAVIREVLGNTSLDQEAPLLMQPSYLRWLRQTAGKENGTAISKPNGEVKELAAQGETMTKMHHQLRGVNGGDVDAGSMLLEGDLLDRLYDEDDCLNRCHAQLVEYLKLVQFKLAKLRILEVGDGLGGLTLKLLEALYGDSASDTSETRNYIFAGVNEDATARVRKRISKFEDFVELRGLEAGKAPADQGFELGSFDVVVASNVARIGGAARDTLSMLKTLLKPAGRLALVEVTNPSLRWGAARGGLPHTNGTNSTNGTNIANGTNGTNGDSPAYQPFLDTSAWQKVLVQSGFSDALLEMKDYDSDEEHEVSLLIPEATVERKDEVPTEKVSIVALDAENATAKSVADALKAQSPDIAVSILPLSEVGEARGTIIFLLEAAHNWLMQPSDSDWTQVRDAICSANVVLWVTTDGTVECPEPRRALVTGLGRSLRSEMHDVDFFTLDIQLGPDSPSETQVADGIQQVYRNVVGPNASPYSAWEWELSARNGTVLVPRVVPDTVTDSWVEDSVSQYHPRQELEVAEGHSLQLSIHSPGIWDTVYWKDSPSHSLPLTAVQISVKLDYASLNLRDVMTSLGQLSGSASLLIEGSGTVLAVGEEAAGKFSIGDSVCFYAPEGLATTARLDQNQACLVPKGMSMEKAAAVPLAYATALFSLRETANLRPGESVLIHSGAGAVGQAAIGIARFLGAKEIFVTVGTAEKRELVKALFGIPDDHIFSSRDLVFSQQILQATHGRGVDVVLNSLSGESIAASCDVLAPFGKFVEIGHGDVLANGRLSAQSFRDNKTLSTVDLALVAKAKPELFHDLLKTCLGLVHTEQVPTIQPITVTPASNVGDRLRQMKAGEHQGKVVLKVDFTQGLKVQPQRPTPPTLDGNASYLVVGGTGGLGRAIVKHLAKLGAKHIITLSRSGADSPGVTDLIEEIQHCGAELVVVKADVCEQSTMDHLKIISSSAPIKGIVHGVMALQDSTVTSMTPAQWRAGLAAKVTGAQNLDTHLSGPLDFFILLGSAGAITGNYGQANYSASNTFLAALARQRASRALPARALDLGWMQDAGFSAGNAAATAYVAAQGHVAQSTAELLALVDFAIAHPVAPSPDAAQIICGGRRADPRRPPSGDAARQRPDARFAHVWGRAEGAAEPVAVGRVDAQAALKAAGTAGEAVEAVYVGVAGKVAQLLDVPEGEMRRDRSVASYGVDSLVELGLRNWIVAHLGARVTMLELMSSLSLVQLAEVVARRSRLVGVGVFEVMK